MHASSPHLTRRQRNRQASIAEILDAARAQMRVEGAAALNFNEVARRVGLRPPSLYEYFPGGKHAVYDALFAQGFTLFGEMMRAANATDDPLEAVRRSIETYLRFAVEQPDLYQICFERPVPGFVPSDESLRISFGILGEGRAATERALAKLGNPLGLGIDEALNLVIALMHGIAALHLANEPHLPPGEGRFGSLIPAAVSVLSLALPPVASMPATPETTPEITQEGAHP
jgi:AcrR family transcriptional regulator